MRRSWPSPQAGDALVRARCLGHLRLEQIAMLQRRRRLQARVEAPRRPAVGRCRPNGSDGERQLLRPPSLEEAFGLRSSAGHLHRRKLALHVQ
jgi:hypothetical protein